MTNRQKKSLIQKIQRQAEKARACYQKKDDLLSELLPHLPVGEIVSTRSGQFQLVDNFAEKNVGYRASSFHRFELKEVKEAKLNKPSSRRAAAPTKANPEPKNTSPFISAGSAHEPEAIEAAA